METKKIIAICQSGGEFVNNKDGSLSYSGGDAYALDVDEKTKLSGFKRELADMYGWASSSMNIKYLLPSNRKTLITVSKDRDLQRMVTFAGDSGSVDVFIFPEASAVNGTIVPASRTNEMTVSEAGPLVEPSNMGYEAMEIHNGEPISSYPAPSNDGQHQVLARDWENTITGVDQRFNSLSDFKEALHKFSVAHRFAYRYKKNDSHRVSVKCKVQGCPWRIYASRLSTTQLIAIKKMNPTHTCDGANVKARYQATRGWVGSIIKDKLKESPNCKAKEIADEIRREYGIELNYSQARRAKKLARMQLQGTSEEAYKLLPLFCEKIKETNPGSIANFSTKEDTTFHRLFVSFHASIVGFRQGCRSLLFLDSVPLLSKYPGVLLAAVSADGDDGIFPVAFAVVDVENEENWYWFLQELKSALLLPTDEQPLTFVADVQNGLKESIAHIFSNAYHAYCLPSLAERLDKDLKGQFSHEARRFMLNDLYSAARATTNDAFQHAVRSIKGISDEAYDWVMQSEPIHWANAFFPGARYEHLGSNFGQEFYRWVAEAQELPITQLIDGLRGKTMDAIYTRRAESNQWLTKLTPSKEEQLQKEAHISQSLHIQISPVSNIFEVSGESTTEMVDIENCTCSCTRWRSSGVPCCHAIAVIVGMERNPYDYCLRYFTTDCYRQSYAESINPVPSFNLLDLNESGDMAIVTVTPPPTRRAPVKAVLKPSDPIDMIKRSLQCSKCKAIGHNKKTCKAG